MLLALDVGNTNITLGVFHAGKLGRQWRLETAEALRPGRLAGTLSKAGRGIRAVVYGSVVPDLDRALEKAVRRVFELRAVRVGPSSALGIRLRVEEPRQVGADRVLNALAAFRRTGSACVVVDFGTATTFDCVSVRGEYLGGAILPGPRMAARALARETAKLPEVAVRRPARVVGKTTAECIQAGVYFGYLGMIEKILTLTLREMGREGRGRSIRVLVTGGLSSLFARDMPKTWKIVPDLTLEGLSIAHEILAGGKP